MTHLRRTHLAALLSSLALTACDKLSGTSNKTKSKEDEDEDEDEDEGTKKKKKSKERKDEGDDAKTDAPTRKPDQAAINRNIVAWSLGAELVKLAIGRTNKAPASALKKAEESCGVYARGLGFELPAGPAATADATDYGVATLLWGQKQVAPLAEKKLSGADSKVGLALFIVSFNANSLRLVHGSKAGAACVDAIERNYEATTLPAKFAKPLREKLKANVPYADVVAAVNEFDDTVTKHLLSLSKD